MHPVSNLEILQIISLHFFKIQFTLFVGLTSYQVLAVLTTDETHKLSAVFPVPLMTHNSQLRMLRTSLIAEVHTGFMLLTFIMMLLTLFFRDSRKS